MSSSCKKKKKSHKSNIPLNFSLLEVLWCICKSLIFMLPFLYLFEFFSKYIATFRYHALYCIAIAQVQIIQENEGQKKENKYGEIPPPRTRHWKQVSAEARKWARGGSERGAVGSDSGSFFSLDLNLFSGIFTACEYPRCGWSCKWSSRKC